MNTQTPPILCGTDFSENAAQAVTAAAVLARLWKRPLILLHAAGEAGAGAEGGGERPLQPARKRLEEAAAVLRATGLEVSAEVLPGRAAEDAICGFVREHPAELVVVSAVSKTAFDRWTLGSVSEHVAESAPAPTVVVRAAAPFEAWEKGVRALKVFVAADFSETAAAALRWVGEWRKLGPCEVTAAYVDWPPEERNRLGVYGPLGLTKNQPGVQSVLERDFREKVVAALGSEPVEIVVRSGWGRVDADLVTLATDAGADLVVVGTHQRHGLARLRHGSVSRGILRHAPMSVACVPATAVPPPPPGVRPCRRVLAAADLTEHGGLALPYAFSVVNDGGTVSLVHVVKPFRLPNPMIGGMPDALPTERELAAQAARASAHLRALVPPEAEARGIKTEVEVVEDEDAARAICRAAESVNADLVCVGANARPGALARAMGSVALGVLQECRRPVLVVWPPAV